MKEGNRVDTGLIEVFFAPCDYDVHPFFAGEPESIGFFTESEIERGEEKSCNFLRTIGLGMYSYARA